MRNFEEAIKRIAALEEENINLKNKLNVALLKISEPMSIDPEYTNNQVGLNGKMRIIEQKKNAAMERFTRRLKNDIKKFRKADDGKK